MLFDIENPFKWAFCGVLGYLMLVCFGFIIVGVFLVENCWG